jgi:diguanylate cyclase (GGDEF)-like protein
VETAPAETDPETGGHLMNLTMIEYLEVNTIGILLLMAMLFFIKRKSAAAVADGHRPFLRMAVLNIVILASDNIIYLFRGHGGTGMILLNQLACAVFFICHTLFCYEWVLYLSARLFPRNRTEKNLFLLIPVMVNTVLAVSSPFTGWLFTLTEDNYYRRGSLILLSTAASAVYLIISTLAVVKEWRHSAKRRSNGEYLILLIFPFALMAANLIQFLCYGLSVVWIACALLMILLFIDLLNDQLSRDRMTGLYNRGYANEQLAWEDEHPSGNSTLFMIMFDLDHFKQINDRYGHLSGDKALISAAAIIRDSSRKSDSAFRYGGDEFLLTGHSENESDVEGILRRIDRSIAAFNRSKKCPFEISVSYGYAVRKPGDSRTADAVLREADENMYLNKHQKNPSA